MAAVQPTHLHPAYVIKRTVIEHNSNNNQAIGFGNRAHTKISWSYANKIGRSIAERSTIEQNRKVDSLTQSNVELSQYSS